MLEGRHGNSIRIGSRAIDPYIIMSNNRAPKNIREGLSDGTIFGITSYGMLKDIQA